VNDPFDFAAGLAQNVKALRAARGFSQAQLAKRAGIPRTTLSLLESGTANPTLDVALRVARALDVHLEELLEARASQTRVVKEADLLQRERGGVTVRNLLPERVEGLDIEQLVIPPGRTLTGIPHTMGTREYLSVVTGQLELRVAGESYRLGAGDVAAFHGSQRHSYTNLGRSVARAFSVIALAPARPPLTREP